MKYALSLFVFCVLSFAISCSGSSTSTIKFVEITTSDIPAAFVNTAYTFQFQAEIMEVTELSELGNDNLVELAFGLAESIADDDKKSTIFEIIQSSLPSGFAISEAGLFSGTSTEAGDYSFAVSVSADIPEIDSHYPNRRLNRDTKLFNLVVQ